MPPERYLQQLQGRLLQRFCQASGLSKQQAKHPETLQQGITLLVSALDAGPKVPRIAPSKTSEPAAPLTAATKAALASMEAEAAGQAQGKNNSAPGRLCKAATQGQMNNNALSFQTKDGAAGRSLGISNCLAGFRNADKPAHTRSNPLLAREHDSFGDGLLGVQGISLSLSGSLDQDIGADIAEALLPLSMPDMEGAGEGLLGIQRVSLSLSATQGHAFGKAMHPSSLPDVEQDECDWMKSTDVNSPAPSQSREHWLDQHYGDSMHTIASMAPGLPMTEDEDEALSPGLAQTWPLPCSSVQLGDAKEQQHAFNRMPELSLEMCLDASMDGVQQNSPESDAKWLDEGGRAKRMGKFAESLREVSAPEHAMPQLDTKVDLLADNDKSPRGYTADWQDIASAGDTDEGQALQHPDAVFSGKREPSIILAESAHKFSGRRRSETSSWPVRVMSERDPVAAFSDFCDSLAV